MWWRIFRCLYILIRMLSLSKEERVVVIHYVIINSLLDSLIRWKDNFSCLLFFIHICLLCIWCFHLLFNYNLFLLSKQSSFEWSKRIEETFLSIDGLLIIQHLLIRVWNKSHLISIHLDLILILFNTSQHADATSNCNIVLREPISDVLLLLASLPALVTKIIQPKHACYHSCGIINYK